MCQALPCPIRDSVFPHAVADCHMRVFACPAQLRACVRAEQGELSCSLPRQATDAWQAGMPLLWTLFHGSRAKHLHAVHLVACGRAPRPHAHRHSTCMWTASCSCFDKSLVGRSWGSGRVSGLRSRRGRIELVVVLGLAAASISTHSPLNPWLWVARFPPWPPPTTPASVQLAGGERLYL